MWIFSSFCLIQLIYCSGSTAITIEERLLQVEQTLKHQQAILENHEKTIKDQEITIRNHEKETNFLKMRLEELENGMRKYSRKVKAKEDMSGNDLQSKEQNQDGNIAEENAPVKDLIHVDKTAVDDKQINSPNLNRIVKRQSNGIAFHAYLTGRKCLYEQQLIVFDTEVIDDGNGYSSTDGIYVVPESGTYVFTWTIFSAGHEWFSADIIIDGMSRGRIFADSDSDQATGVIIAQVNLGNHVFIRREKGDGCYTNDIYSRSTFTGWKLF